MRSRARVGRVFPRNFEFSQTFTSVSLGRVSGIHGQPIRRNMTTVLENETMQMKTKLDWRMRIMAYAMAYNGVSLAC